MLAWLGVLGLAAYAAALAPPMRAALGSPMRASLRRTGGVMAGATLPETIYSVSEASVSSDLERLAARSGSWGASSMEERVLVAEAILEALRSEDWGGPWLEAQVDLEGIEGADARRASASQTRFVFGSTVMDMVSSFIEAHAGDGAKREAVVAGEAVAVGAAVPGATFEVRKGVAPMRPVAVGGAAPGTVSLVLGAGNQSFLSLLDALQRALVDGECVFVKHHPLRPWLVEPFAKILGPLIELDVVAQCVDAGPIEAAALVADARVGHVHITGSEKTRDAVRATLDGAGKRDVAISAELGCATPWIITPGEWTDVELTNAAKALVAAKKANGGSNCLSPQAVLLADLWPQKEAFLAKVTAELQSQKTFKAYYPGAPERRDAMLERYGQPPLGATSSEVALLDVGVLESDRWDDAALREEVFGPLLAVAFLPGGQRAAGSWLLERAVPFANSDAMLGSLSCTLLSPATLDPTFVDATLDQLNYGSVAHNCWSVFGYTSMCNGGTWGAHPTDVDGRSGAGIIGNVYGVPGAVKTVVRSGTMAKPAVDLSKPPPPIVFDALHAALIKHQGSDALKAALNLLLRRGLAKLRGLLPGGGGGGRKFGGAL